MATTKSGFLKYTRGGVTSIVAVAAAAIDAVKNALGATRVDLLTVNLATASYAKEGGVRLAFSGTTPQTLSLLLTSTAASYDGDTTLASLGQIKFLNDGATSITVAPGASNGLSLPFSSLTVAAGAEHVFTFATPLTVDGTHKNLDLTPASGGSLVVTFGGA